jgi:hypothetical protein
MSGGRGAYGRSRARLSTRLAGPRFADKASAMGKLDPKQEERLAAALRDNLKRRKAQSRAGDPEVRPTEPDPAP